MVLSCSYERVIEHKPTAEHEANALLSEPIVTRNTGNVDDFPTVEAESLERIRYHGRNVRIHRRTPVTGECRSTAGPTGRRHNPLLAWVSWHLCVRVYEGLHGGTVFEAGVVANESFAGRWEHHGHGGNVP